MRKRPDSGTIKLKTPQSERNLAHGSEAKHERATKKETQGRTTMKTETSTEAKSDPCLRNSQALQMAAPRQPNLP